MITDFLQKKIKDNSEPPLQPKLEPLTPDPTTRVFTTTQPPTTTTTVVPTTITQAPTTTTITHTPSTSRVKYVSKPSASVRLPPKHIVIKELAGMWCECMCNMYVYVYVLI